ncbi:T9SS type A sorting domain-containing protein [Kaistella sp. 97-N-M2]|uniref:DUF1573 domain-containing protein n=1 Tax=Kaistella sp. 97-N-M2 TaxID=2908645 RepID=UPI001F2C17C8|nr:T9SS type A sorting domain-containing protein [Kaistella sp. 97-N-M2]UJF28800.1 T9SS type A sorting domain-containing protein [Kaistella sp. 97-N-M2]
MANNLNANQGPIDITNPSVRYYDPPNVVAPIFFLNHLLFQNNLDEVRFSFNAPSTYSDGIIFQLHIGIGGLGFGSVSGNIKVYMQVDSLPEALIGEKNLNASVFIAGGDADDFSIALTGLTVNSLVKIRVVGASSTGGATINFFGVNDLKLVKDVTSISVRGTKVPQPPLINHNDPASVINDTDFGSVLTSDIPVDKTYRITNTGSRTLKISSLQLIPNDVGFSIIGTVPNTISVGQNATFTVRFVPADQGIATSEIVIAANITPNNPFRFEVKGNGKSCNLEPVPILVQNFETSGSNLSAVLISGIPGSTGNTSNSPNPIIQGVSGLYPSSTNLFAAGSSTRSLFVRGHGTDESGVTGTNDVTLEFGPIDITGQQEVSVNFEVAAFSSSNVGSSGNTTGSGVNGYDYVLLQVLKKDGITWSDEIKLYGSGSNASNEWADRSYKYGLGGTLIPESSFDGVLVTINNTGTMKYGKFKLNIPTSELTNNFKFRIVARTGRSRDKVNTGKQFNRNLWLIDNVHVDAGNAKSKTWTGAAWTGDDTSRPTSREKAVFAGNYNFAGSQASDLSVCECEVNNGVNLTIPAGRMLSVRNKIINAGAADNFIVESDGNLLQEENSIVNANNITSKRLIKIGSARNQYNYLGTPVDFQTGESFQTIFPGSSTTVLYHNQATNYFSTSSGVNIPGRGLAVKEPTISAAIPATATNTTGIFKGVPQNGAITIAVANKDTGVNTYGYNLIGNPYPSNIDLLKLYDLNGGRTGSSQIESPNISATFYFWDNTGNTQMTQQGSGYGGQAYAIFNVLSGVNGTGTKSMLGSKVPTNIVKVGQGFMTRSLIAAYNFKFNNSIRTNSTSVVDFLGQRQAGIQDDRYWLQMTAPSGITSTIAIVYYAGGNNLFGAEDSRSLGGSDALYSRVESEKVAIDGRSAFVKTDEVPLGTQHYAEGNYTLSLDAAEGRFANGQNIYLKDVRTGIITNLSAGSYTFAASAGASTGRFEIIYEPEAVLATDSAVKDDVLVYRKGGDFVVKAASKAITTLEMYDAVGRLLYKARPNTTEVTVPAERFPGGVYILRIDQHGLLTMKKVMK